VWLSAFHEHGVVDVLGIDGPWADDAPREMPDTFFASTTCARPLELDRAFDLALCLESCRASPTEAAEFLVEGFDLFGADRLLFRSNPFKAEMVTSTNGGQASGPNVSLRTDIAAQSICAPFLDQWCGGVLVSAEHGACYVADADPTFSTGSRRSKALRRVHRWTLFIRTYISAWPASISAWPASPRGGSSGPTSLN
jgi:hypothetical protein